MARFWRTSLHSYAGGSAAGSDAGLGLRGLGVAALGLAAMGLGSCTTEPLNAPVNVVVIGEGEAQNSDGAVRTVSSSYVRAAINEGLVSLGSTGEVIPAIAERWIVTDDGLSYIFRLRNSSWPSGDPFTAEDIELRLTQTIAQLEATALAKDLAKIVEIRAMTGRVIEIRLASPMPDFLRLMAQPELGLERDGSGAGPMVLERASQSPDATSAEAPRSASLQLLAVPPEARGYPAIRNWKETVSPVNLTISGARDAVEAFGSGEADLVLGGRIASFPLADLGPLSRANIRLDAALGVFGLIARNEEGVMADPQLREAMSMAIGREALIEPFNISGWVASTGIVPRDLWGDVLPETVSWAEQSIEERQATAAARVSAWEAANGESAEISIALPAGPGSDELFTQIAANFASIGIEASRAKAGDDVDWELYDLTARYASPRWFFNQFNCEVVRGPCSLTADALVRDSLTEIRPKEKAELLARAELALLDEAIFIPFGTPIRWSLVRSDIEAFQENRWAAHPLFPLSRAPI